MSGGGDSTVEDTPEQRELAAVAAEKWNFAQQELAPLEDAYMRQVDDLTSEENLGYIRGRTMQAQQQAADGLMDEAGQRLTAAGIDPSSGRYQGAMTGLALDTAQAGGETLGRAEFEQDNQQVLGMQNIVSIGQGQAGQAQAGLAGLADQASADARQSAATQFNRRSANLQLLGQVAGAGTSYGLNQTGGTPGLGMEGGVSQAAINSSNQLWG
ncbi:hypothetical protein HPA02_08450 [Bisbaumannia pacifica]|uniref:Uncharacterized protein n=1 Tax=Bisbaumannia pacifica TaxID=77098 RepID=A0A510X558_9GAMM|nr:hypothetical protein [Halomonas pacifica]GEK46562.1 hypothetical protein HPA02_08450 [Halomonas pacifica]